MQDILQHLFAIRDSQSISSAEVAIRIAFSDLGFNRIALAVNKPNEAEYAEDPDVTNLSTDIIREYKSGRMREFDFNLERGRSFRSPFWFGLECGNTSPRAKRFSDFLLSCEIREGVSFVAPSSNGLMSGIVLSAGAGARRSLKTLTYVGILTNTAIMKLETLRPNSHISADEANRLRELTNVQMEILKWASEGKSNSDIATILGLSIGGVNYHVRTLVTKMGVYTKAQAIAIFSRAAV